MRQNYCSSRTLNAHEAQDWLEATNADKRFTIFLIVNERTEFLGRKKYVPILGTGAKDDTMVDTYSTEADVVIINWPQKQIVGVIVGIYAPELVNENETPPLRI